MENPKRFYTYAYLREDRTPYYIGKGKGRRLYVKRYKGINPPKDKIRIIFLKQNLTEQEAFEHEIYMISVFGRKDLGSGILHNRTDGGDGKSGAIQSDETRIKISEATKGQIRTEETRRRMSESKKGENNYRYGKPLSEKHKLRLSEAMKGKRLTEETKRKISEGHKGKTLSEEHKRKMSEANKNPSEETKRKISEANKDKRWWNDSNGNTKFAEKCPGEGWIAGRGTIPRKPKVLI
jgi:hypothetical protein